ncbi:MAG: HAD family hydrolase [Deltaproteobacteria bacterium]|nr:HAD family hydrolase [Deltaproteobacteria bacterium]
MSAIAFFDLDKTLISRNSATLWIRAELAAGRVTTWQALHALTYAARYSLGFVAIDETIRRSIATVAGQPEAPMRDRAQAFYRQSVRPLFRPGARAAIDAHRAAGERLVLLTSSSNYMSELTCAELGLDDFICNHFEIDADGRYTGRAIEPLCYGAGKVALATRYAAAHGAALQTATFYTDSFADLPMLEVVGRPVAVNPDPKLRRAARRRGWPVVDWGRPD